MNKILEKNYIILDKILTIILLILLSTGFVLSQNQITIFKTDNKGLIFYYNPTSTAGFERELKIGLSNYLSDLYGNYSGNNRGSWDNPLLEFKPSGNFLNEINKNIFRILNYRTKTNLTAIRIGSGSNDPNSYSRILFDPNNMRVIFDSGRQNGFPFEGEFILSRLYANIGDLIAIYSCEETRDNPNATCLGREGVYKVGTQPPGAIFSRYVPNHTHAAFYRNPNYCFGDSNLGRVLKHICLGDCSGDDEALTFCIRTKY